MSDFPLPPDLPRPVDTGACAHLPGRPLPATPLQATTGERVDLSTLPGWVVVFCYPMTGTPGVPLPTGWNEIPGARGCTPQACGFRDAHAALAGLGAAVVGLSAQPPEEQREAAQRLGLAYPLLSDEDLAFANRLGLPRFEVDGRVFLERVTLVAQDGAIEKVFHPVFPPDQNAAEVLDWLVKHALDPDVPPRGGGSAHDLDE